MNTPDVPGPSEDQSSVNSHGRLASPSRRRFARGGFAATALLGSLHSMPVLGQTAPYDCTLSGMVSGNQSFRGTRSTSGKCINVGIGLSPAQWMSEMSWVPYVKGALPTVNGSNACYYSSPDLQGTLFKDAMGVDVFFAGTVGADTSAVCAITYSAGGTVPRGATPATLLQVLSQYGKSDDLTMGAIFGATLLNCTRAGFPLSPAQVKDMYQQVRTTGMFKTTTAAGDLAMDKLQVLAYLQNLYNTAA
jgi:hypothetical protein